MKRRWTKTQFKVFNTSILLSLETLIFGSLQCLFSIYITSALHSPAVRWMATDLWTRTRIVELDPVMTHMGPTFLTRKICIKLTDFEFLIQVSQIILWMCILFDL